MMMFMPLIFGFMFYNFPSGLVLYYLTSNLVSMGQQWFFNHTALGGCRPSRGTAQEEERQEITVTERKYSVASIGSRIDGFCGPPSAMEASRCTYEISGRGAAEGDFETPDVVVKFSGADVDLLLANRAELLLALEHVTMEMLRMPSEDHSRISFDANDYRLLRIEELRLSAMTAAEKVKRTGVPFRFNPMNSRERRVIHLALRGETAVRSESFGAGPGGRWWSTPPAWRACPSPLDPEMRRAARWPPRRGRRPRTAAAASADAAAI
jgi:spoIIIJ-associated protein